MSGIARIHVKHIAAEVASRYEGHLYLDDVSNSNADRLGNAVKTRGLAAFALQSVVADLDCENAASCVTDGTRDNGIDAIYVDPRDSRIYVVQSKWHDGGTASISVGDMHKFVRGLRDLTEEKFDRFSSRFDSVIPGVEAALGNPGVTFCMVLATTGSSDLSDDVSAVVSDAKSEMNEISEMLTVRVLGLSELHEVLRAGGAAPKIDMEVTLEGWGSLTEPYSAFYGVVDGATVASWYMDHGGNLFDDNLRKALGPTAVNAEMLETVDSEPESFWYFNNGITALCDSVTKTGRGGSSRISGDFAVTGISIVNGAQTVSSLADRYKLDATSLEAVRVWIRLISLETCPDEFATNVTRATNTQNVVENRDFISLDPVQQRLQDDLRLSLERRYVFKRGEVAPDAEHGCTVSEAIVALACANPDSGLAVLAKSAIGRLEDPRGRYYSRLFNGSTTAFELWQCVQVYRIVESSLLSLRSTAQGKQKAVALQGNRIIAHAVFQEISKECDLSADLGADGLGLVLEKVAALTARVLEMLSEHVEIAYASNYVTSLFKNAAKCADVARHLRSELAP